MTAKHWFYGLGAAFIGGGAAAVTASISAVVIAPDAFNLGNQLGNFFKLAGATFLISGFLQAMGYLKQSPLPTDEPPKST
jgi:hypothetical protein